MLTLEKDRKKRSAQSTALFSFPKQVKLEQLTRLHAIILAMGSNCIHFPKLNIPYRSRHVSI